ncbi:2-C-methyl-D-erythritol 4-phosphate cytidylyltransferase [Nocardioides sp. BP30]|uniref:2-C-methyl-D-erythritol 4-phosphate cytidylyltransferase n=1 Tax=Nocardioides sp. BP30 TaxID=3036374 RepID=UPI0024690452|nr:2-C-methyl-D-erythritol 4-phosphate cytidylyltransferase [Nocardioides sp. BP30]WGL53101.1 2-C-methyl-D-erythritol 4-phosphate cytidylyltransferase [Nocardioides sp. BP30]
MVEADRGSLPFALIHGEALVACAVWALGEAGVTPVDFTLPWEAVVEAGQPYVLHDPLCPMTPASFVARCVTEAVARDVVVVAVRPVTDTVKIVADGLVGDTLDRSELVEVTSPIVLPASAVARLDELPSGDFATLAAQLATRFPIHTLEAPAEGRRVADLDDVRVLEALTLG